MPEEQNEVLTPPYIDQLIPDITLEAYHEDDTKEISLRKQKGKWLVLLFYPADFTFVCPTELESAAEHYKEFQKIGAEIMSISTDTVFVHKAWHDNSEAIGKITYPMLADPAAKLCRALGTYLEDVGESLRTTVIIDPEGKIKAYDIHSNDIGRSIDEIYRKVQAAKFVSEHSGMVCPVNWQPGEETLKKGLDLVGKI